jgi:release factor glutamine methyltransferase
MLSTQKQAGAQPSWFRAVAAAAVRNWLALRYRVLSRRYNRLVLEQIDGVPLIVLPHVFNPVLLRTGAFMARTLARLPGGELSAGMSVLDMGAGSGIGAVFAARRGARVIAVDINPEAVRCARMNALLNHIEDKIDVREGDLFAPVAGLTFDLVLFNPPFYQGQPRDNLDHAWRGQDVFGRFARGLSAALKPGGRALLVLSSDGDCGDLLAELQASGYTIESLAQQDLINEVLTIYAVQC